MERFAIDGDLEGREATPEQYKALETGGILYFPTTPFALGADERAVLLAQKQVEASYHKNISYRPAEDRLKGVDQDDDEERRRVHEVMRSYSRRAIDFTGSFLRKYAASWKIDFASFRPIEEAGRKVKLKARNDLIHVDSFPTRPSHGDRLLRIFTNIHPDRARVWVTSDPFEPLARAHARAVGLPASRPGVLDDVQRQALRLLKGLGLPVVDRPAYDRFMLRFHHWMKQNAEFQRDCPKYRWEFPAGSTWMVFTDTASHSCISGQYALEQTFIVRRDSLAYPDKAPIAILEQMTGFPLAASRARSA